MTRSKTLAGGICLVGILGLCFVIHAETEKKTPSANQEPLVDRESSVVDVVVLDNRVIDIQPGDVFYLTASGPAAEKGVSVDLDNGEYGIVVRTGSRVPVVYYAPGVYKITCDVVGEHLKPIKVNVIAPPKDLAKKPFATIATSPSLNAMTITATGTEIGGSVGSVYAGDYSSGTDGKYPVRIVVQTAGDFKLMQYGGSYSQTWHFNAPGETNDVIDGPEMGQSPWTLIKSDGSGTHVLSPNSPYRLAINNILMHSGPSYIGPPRTDLTSLTVYLSISTPIVLVVDPGPGWASNNTPRTDQLYEWKIDGVSKCFAVSNSFSFSTPGTYQVSVECYSPPIGSQIKSLTIKVFGMTITHVPDWIVPGCVRNTIIYNVEGEDFDSGKCEVFDKNNLLVYEDTTISTVVGSHSIDWNGKRSTDGQPLTESESPYRIVVTGTKGTCVSSDEETDQKVEEWGITQPLTDPLKDGFASGTDVTKVTPNLVKVKIEDNHTGGSCSPTAISFDAVEALPGVDMLLADSPGVDHVFYVMPTDKSYTLTTEVMPGGAEDRAGNGFDADDTEAGAQKSFSYTFRIQPGGSITILSENAW